MTKGWTSPWPGRSSQLRCIDVASALAILADGGPWSSRAAVPTVWPGVLHLGGAGVCACIQVRMAGPLWPCHLSWRTSRSCWFRSSSLTTCTSASPHPHSRDRLHRLPARPSQGPVRVHTTSVVAAVDSCAPRLSASQAPPRPSRLQQAPGVPVSPTAATTTTTSPPPINAKPRP